MNSNAPSEFYRKPSKKRLRQGDIAIGEFHQIRNRSGEPLGPGPERVTDSNLPFFGEYTNHELKLPRPDGNVDICILRTWRGLVIVLHQNCEIDFAHQEDSRLVVAPLVSRLTWPEAPWDYLERNQLPGYFYLPALSGEAASELGLEGEMPETVVVLANTTSSSIGLIRPFRILSLAIGVLPYFQNAVSKFFCVRGFGSEQELNKVIGKKILKVVDTGQSIAGPSKLVKAYVGSGSEGSEGDDDEDELTVVNFGVRV